MSLRDRLRRLRRAAEEDAALIRLKDGSVRAFPRERVLQEVFLSRLDAALGRPPRDSEIMQALENATEESRRDIEQAFVGGFMEDLEPRDEPVEDLSE